MAKVLHTTTWLLDGSLYFFRGYFGLPDSLVDASGEPCGGVHGLARALLAALQRHGPAPGLVAFDKSLGTCFRNDIHPDYKANRAPPDDNIIYQFAQCERLCELLGISHVSDTRYEADDLLAVASKNSLEECIIYSKDKDLRQLVSVSCSLRDLLGDDLHDLAGFRATYGFEPELFPDYQALVGDTSDNVPGVPGFGPKTAAKLIAKYGVLEQVIESRVHWSEDKVGIPSEGKLAANLVVHAEQALVMRKVLRLSSQAPLAGDAINRQAVQVAALQEFIDTMRLRGFGAGLKRLGLI